MYSFQECQEIVNKAFRNFNLQKEPSNLYKPMEYIISMGGKRIRPATVIRACNLFTDDIEEAINPVMGIEIFHNFTLVHDDIMDKAPIRRSQPTVHKKWNENIAILSGDAMCILAYRFFLKAKPEIQAKILPEFTKTALEVCEGQQLDMDFENFNNVTVSEYIRMISGKTSVLLASSLKIGAIIGGASEKDAENLYEFGKNLGIAFQLQDDLLDVFADPKKFGKKTGNDIATNKKTFLLIKALEMSKGEDYSNLKTLIENKSLNDE